MAKVAVILPAAGQSSRFGGKEKKPFANLDGRPIWLRTAELFVTRDDVVQTLLVLAPEEIEWFREKFAANIAFMDVKVVTGGRERFESVANSLAMVKPEVELIAVHDVVRPCVPPALIDQLFAVAAERGSALPAVPVADTLKRVSQERVVSETVARDGLWQAQTPQVFKAEWLRDAYARRGGFVGKITDDAQLVAAAGHAVHVVEGDPGNIKITTRNDVMLADAILKSRPKPKNLGPAHPFADEDMWR